MELKNVFFFSRIMLFQLPQQLLIRFLAELGMRCSLTIFVIFIQF